MAYARHRFWLQAILTISLLGPSHGQLNESFHYTELTQAFPLVFTSPLSHSPSYGGQNFTQCCVEAVIQSYSVQNGRIVLNPNNYVLGLSPNDFNMTKFPCGATYDGNAAGAKEVVIPYSWCRQNCGGWEKSANSPLTQWVQPFVGFILPAAVFCLNVRYPLPLNNFLADSSRFPDNQRRLGSQTNYLVITLKTCHLNGGISKVDQGPFGRNPAFF